ncbi:MAG: hypothetical protein R2745_24010 [Vicinamibacterales bacterium]
MIPERPRYSRRRLFALLGGAAAAVASCVGEPPLAHASDTPEALLTAVLDRLAARDRGGLDALALSEEEFRRLVWPSLPAARPERNLPFSYVWGDLHQKSDASLRQVLARHGGRRYRLEHVRFEGETSAYAAVTVHRGAVVDVRDDGGESAAIRVCGSLVERAGRWKVFSYVVDD